MWFNFCGLAQSFSGGFLFDVTCIGELFQHIPCQYADDGSRDNSRYDKHREVDENLDVGNQKGCDQDLTEIVGDAACHGNTHHGEYSCLLQHRHDQEADDGACQRVQCAEQAVEQKSGYQDSDDVDGDGVACSKVVQGDDDHDVGNAQLDAGNACVEGNQHLDI